MSNTQRPIFSNAICLQCLRKDDQITRQGAAISDLIDKCEAALYEANAMYQVVAAYEERFGALVPEGAEVIPDGPDDSGPGHD